MRITDHEIIKLIRTDSLVNSCYGIATQDNSDYVSFLELAVKRLCAWKKHAIDLEIEKAKHAPPPKLIMAVQ